MPWDGSELYYSDFSHQGPCDRQLVVPQKIAGESGKISINDIKWSSTNPSELFYLSDETGFVNLWSIDLSQPGSKPRLAMKPINYDLGEPLWRLVPSWYAILTDVDALVAPNINGLRKLHHLDLSTGEITEIPNGYTDISDLRRINDKQAAYLGRKWDSPKTIVMATLGSSPGEATFLELDAATPRPEATLDKAFISRGEHIVLQVDSPQGADTRTQKVDLHVTLYRPTNPCYQSPEGDLPPTLVQAHGGPTARASPTFSIFHQYFTTRGFAVLDVDYGGSSGYGREYQERLHGAWGIVDVQDTIRAVKQLSVLGMIDGKKVAIRGSSAGMPQVLRREGSRTLLTLTSKAVSLH
jgi:dipeptidyl aminopeptidase/acylaminoacyl peptidase